MGSKSVLSSVTSVRLLAESGTRDYCSNWPLLVALNLFFVGLRGYLSGHRQRVVINGVISDWALIFAGVPQGSILEPLICLIFINDIVNNIQSNICLFADDASLYIFVEIPNTAALALNSDLGTIHHWANNWLIDFNPTKTTSLLISRKRIPETHPTLKMNNTDLS